jgi:carbonic anhydrase
MIPTEDATEETCASRHNDSMATWGGAHKAAIVIRHVARFVDAGRAAAVAFRHRARLLGFASTADVRQAVDALKASGPLLADAIAKRRLTIVGAEYHLGTGRVGFMS